LGEVEDALATPDAKTELGDAPHFCPRPFNRLNVVDMPAPLKTVGEVAEPFFEDLDGIVACRTRAPGSGRAATSGTGARADARERWNRTGA
jgi:hypothetical protein